MIKLFTIVFLFTSVLMAQVKVDADKIKSQKIRTVTKVTTDLKASDNFSSKPVSVSVYDENGNQTEFIKYDMSGEIEIRYFYKYDERGNTIEVIGQTKSGGLANRWVYEYDANNNLTRQTSYRPDGLIGRDYVFSYDENGLRILDLIYDNKQLIEQAEYIYELHNEEE